VIKENLKALIDYRLQQADESLQAAAVLFEKELYRPSVNRSYYAMYYAVMGLLAAEKKETSKHSGVIALFDRDFVKKGLFTKDFSRWLHAAFDMRQRSDYPTRSLELDRACRSFSERESPYNLSASSWAG
jgi:uncharacterized protein (UPF0332 family)